jgi:hypothetical protein
MAVGEGGTWQVDEAALRELAARYATAVDAGDADRFAALFLPEGRIRMFRPGDGAVPSVDIAGLDDLRAIPASLARRYTATFHFVGHAVYEAPTGPDGDAAGTVYCLAHHLNREAGTDHVMHIQYRDRYRRNRQGEWRIVSREGAIPWTETRLVDALPVPTDPGTAA